ncbi:pantoate--beta-alanine ligase [Mucilaginibacter sp. HMF5004]|uniref:pantoate--beta-alanine ligase n=1 Tax=Mucilaginibacter rivuli TaxID=2857527 RepID=UPI001C5E6D93|nr:pantoate--beta-alanine ligase [Mucilaginibacter rivuli]MBW4888342.1 pantoate--beta-alanine ligase [Mucilaginibacter rivuli]
MKIFTTRENLHNYLDERRLNNKTIGLVPTMGALHNGHLSLLDFAKSQTDEVVCSIFVNPTQFTDPTDLEKYPRPIESDIKKLESAGCDVLFNPPVSEMYTANETWHLNIGHLEHLLEGAIRPGHYQGVTQIVSKLFNLIEPDIAFFGQKDYQQVLVIDKMVQLLNMKVKVVMCPIVREDGGLAMSSRNVYLNAADREHALVLSKALNLAKEQFAHHTFTELTNLATDFINTEPGVKLDYFEIADGDSLYPATPLSKKIVALVAARVGNTRLIDNVILS